MAWWLMHLTTTQETSFRVPTVSLFFLLAHRFVKQVYLTSRKYVRVISKFYVAKRVSRGIHNFLIFAPTHRLWVVVRTASARRFYLVPKIYVLSKSEKFSDKNFHFLKLKNIAWASFHNDSAISYFIVHVACLLNRYMNQVDSLHVGRCLCEVKCCTIKTSMSDLEVMVMDHRFFFFFNSVLRPFQDYFSSYETGQSVGGEKTGEPREKPPDTPASRTWLVSHVQADLGLSHMWPERGSNPHQSQR